VWPLQQLLSLLAPSAAATLQQQLAATAGRVLAAAAGPVQQAARELELPQDTCAFELLGESEANLLMFGVWSLGVLETFGRVLAAAAGQVQQTAQELRLPQDTCAF
jgi:hypothetical protein